MNPQTTSIPVLDKIQAALKICPLESSCQSDTQLNVPHRHDNFEIIWIKKGSGQVSVDMEKYDIKPNHVYCISPGQIHSLSAHAGVEGIIISFTQEILGLKEENLSILYNSGLFVNYKQLSAVMVAHEVSEGMADTLEQIEKEYRKNYSLRGEILGGLMKIFLLHLTRQFEKPALVNGYTRNKELVKRFMMLLDKHYASRKMVLDYADELAVTPNYLNEIVKKVSGHPVSYHIKQRIALEAKRQATYALCSMKEIALNLGFEDMAHFSRYFKRVVGINFSNFKKATGDYPGMQQ